MKKCQIVHSWRKNPKYPYLGETDSRMFYVFIRESPAIPGHRQLLSATRKIIRGGAVTLLCLLLCAVSAFATIYRHLQGNIRQHDFTSLINNARPSTAVPLDQKEGQPINILLLGSDSRSGKNAGSFRDGVEGMRSDTAMLAHISANRKRVDVVSIPRDTLVDIPSCTLPNGRHTPARTGAIFNSAFMIGGAGGDVNAAATCTLQTVEKLTDVLIDGYVVLDFVSFQDVVNAIGGVEMCFDERVRDRYAGLDIPAGCHVLDGGQALAFARARKSLGDGSDISRIGRQQEFVGKVFHKISHMNLFSDLPGFYKIVKAISKNLDTSQGVGDFDWLSGFLYSMRHIKQSDLNFVTMPFTPLGNRVIPAENAKLVWDSLRRDKPIPEEIKNPQNADGSRISDTENRNRDRQNKDTSPAGKKQNRQRQ